eukprot:Gb_29320 [translate_table: standard]
MATRAAPGARRLDDGGRNPIGHKGGRKAPTGLKNDGREIAQHQGGSMGSGENARGTWKNVETLDSMEEARECTQAANCKNAPMSSKASPTLHGYSIMNKKTQEKNPHSMVLRVNGDVKDGGKIRRLKVGESPKLGFKEMRGDTKMHVDRSNGGMVFILTRPSLLNTMVVDEGDGEVTLEEASMISL